MKKVELILILFFINYLNIFCQTEKNGVVTETWEDGSPKVIVSAAIDYKLKEITYYQSKKVYRIAYYNEVNLEKDSIWTWYYENGKKMQEVSSFNGNRNGPATTWWENGKIKSQGNYIEGKETGLWKYWDSTGNLEIEITAKEGKHHGRYTEYYTDGIKKVEGFYVNGLQNGIFYFWDKDGALIEKKIYNMGEIVDKNGTGNK